MSNSGDEENKEISYNKATERLEEIIGALEKGEVDIDELATNVKEAARLLELCKSKIERAEMEVKEIAQHLESEIESDADGQAVKNEEIPPEEAEDVPF